MRPRLSVTTLKVKMQTSWQVGSRCFGCAARPVFRCLTPLRYVHAVLASRYFDVRYSSRRIQCFGEPVNRARSATERRSRNRVPQAQPSAAGATECHVSISELSPNAKPPRIDAAKRSQTPSAQRNRAEPKATERRTRNQNTARGAQPSRRHRNTERRRRNQK